MRDAFRDSVVRIVDNRHVFLTGDLGFQALEPLAEVMGDRFINVGIAEQNMIGMAAGLARAGMAPWCYSIAPFVYARPFEQIRNDIGLHNLPVRLVGNGGGYGYGVMGATHHAIEDYGVMCAIQNMRCYIPAFDKDVDDILFRMAFSAQPSYLRLGRQEHSPTFLPDYAPWRQLVVGQRYKREPVIVACGPLAGALLAQLTAGDGPYVTDCWEPTHRKSLWCVSELPLLAMPDSFIEEVTDNQLIIVEEHIEQGGLGQQLLYELVRRKISISGMKHYCACGYKSHRYGSQQYHRTESNINPEAICRT